MEYDLKTPFRELKQKGEWPVPWTSAIGLTPLLGILGKDVVGCEIGVSFGLNLIYTLDTVPNISKVYAIDPFMPYEDGPGKFVTQENSNNTKASFLDNIKEYEDRVVFINKTADDAHTDIEDNSLDYIFIDGDHSYGAVTRDIANYYSKVKSGGVVSGHDISWEGVKQALIEFLERERIDGHRVNFCSNDVWYFIKP